MRITLPLIAAGALALGACAVNPYGTGYGGYGSYGNNYNPVYGSVGAVGMNYGGGFRQAAANTCANHASRYGPVSVRNVQQINASHVRVIGSVSRGYRNESWNCTVRSDGRITRFRV